VTPSLPAQDIDGNDLAGGKVEPNPCISDVPIYSNYDPVEAIRAMAKKAQVQQLLDRGRRVNERLEKIVTPKVPIEADVSDGNDQGKQSEDLGPIEEARISTRMLVSKQELQKLKEQAISENEASKVPVWYYVKNNVLMRKWRPREVYRRTSGK